MNLKFSMPKITKPAIVSLIMVIILMWVIFFLSSQSAVESENLSKSISKNMVLLMQGKNADVMSAEALSKQFETYNFRIRNAAHVIIFFVLALLSANTIFKVTENMNAAYLLTFFICFIFAVGDETKKLFIIDRSTQFKDFFFDFVGIFIGVVFYSIIWLIAGVYGNMKKDKRIEQNEID